MRWSQGFIHYQLVNGRAPQHVDDITRACLSAIPNTLVSAARGRRIHRNRSSDAAS
jgi:hypothetical protein